MTPQEALARSNPSAPTSARTLPANPLATFDRFRELMPSIEGWFSIGASALWDSLLVHQREQRITGHLLEIGVWHGRSAALLAMHAVPGTSLFLVDHEFQNEPLDRALAAARPAPGVEVAKLEGDSTRLHIHPIVTEFFHAMRWIHIDGEHSARAVMSDMALADKLLARDGVLVIDDFFTWLYPQITEAVFRYVRENPEDFALFLCGYNKAYLARPHFVHNYLAFCAERLPDALADRKLEATVAKTTYPAEMNTFGVGPRFQDKVLRGPDWDDRTIRY